MIPRDVNNSLGVKLYMRRGYHLRLYSNETRRGARVRSVRVRSRVIPCDPRGFAPIRSVTAECTRGIIPRTAEGETFFEKAKYGRRRRDAFMVRRSLTLFSRLSHKSRRALQYSASTIDNLKVRNDLWVDLNL